MGEIANREALRVLEPELGTRPRVWYKNLARFDHCFIGGTVSRTSAGVRDCVAGAAVELYRNDSLVISSTTDAFGDFRFDGLAPASGDYEVRVRHGSDSRKLAVTLREESVYIGEIAIANATANASQCDALANA